MLVTNFLNRLIKAIVTIVFCSPTGYHIPIKYQKLVMCGIILLIKIMTSPNENMRRRIFLERTRCNMSYEVKNHLKYKNKLQYDEMVINDIVKKNTT